MRMREGEKQYEYSGVASITNVRCQLHIRLFPFLDRYVTLNRSSSSSNSFCLPGLFPSLFLFLCLLLQEDDKCGGGGTKMGCQLTFISFVGTTPSIGRAPTLLSLFLFFSLSFFDFFSLFFSLFSSSTSIRLSSS